MSNSTDTRPDSGPTTGQITGQITDRIADGEVLAAHEGGSSTSRCPRRCATPATSRSPARRGWRRSAAPSPPTPTWPAATPGPTGSSSWSATAPPCWAWGTSDRGAALPVMEGESALFKTSGGLNSIPLVLDTTDVDEIVETLVRLRPSFGAENLEDVSAPRCFELERRLVDALDCPVVHDDQHGTAIVLLAALKGRPRSPTGT